MEDNVPGFLIALRYIRNDRFEGSIRENNDLN